MHVFVLVGVFAGADAFKANKGLVDVLQLKLTP